MIIDTSDTYMMIASWDRWKGNGYAHLMYPSVSVSSCANSTGVTIREGDRRAYSLTKKEGEAIDDAIAKSSMLNETMTDVTIAWVRTQCNASAVEKITGVSRKAVPTLAQVGMDVIGEKIILNLSATQKK